MYLGDDTVLSQISQLQMGAKKSQQKDGGKKSDSNCNTKE